MNKKEEILFNLETSILDVKFVKKDGTKREMICTLKPEFVPEVYTTVRERPANLIPVIDLEVNSWRMVNLDTLISWEVVD